MSTKNIVYVGVDVGDTAFHGAGIVREETGNKTNWTDRHISWLRKRAKTLRRPLCRIDLVVKSEESP